MRAPRSPAAKAGAVTGALFPALNILLLVVLVGPQKTFAPITRLYLTEVLIENHLMLWLVLPVVFVILILGLGGAGLSILCGLAFAKIRGNLPFRSTYLNALIFGLFLFLIYSLLYARGLPVEYSFSCLFMLDGVIFAFLFDHWTGLDQTKSNNHSNQTTT